MRNTLRINLAHYVRQAALLAPISVAALSCPDAFAQKAPERGVPVQERNRLETSGREVRLGGFRLSGQVAVEELYDDNLFRDDTNQEGDLITIIHPHLRLRSDWTRHFLSLVAQLKQGFHLENSTEDYTDVSLASRGRVDIARDHLLNLTVRWDNRHEERESPEDNDGVEPNEVDRYLTEAIYTKRGTAISYDLGIRHTEWAYENNDDANGVTINNADRDRGDTVLLGRVSYEFHPKTKLFQRSFGAFVEGEYNTRSYDQTPDDDGFIRDSDGYLMRGGVRMDFGGVIVGKLHVGYLSQSYDDARFETIDGMEYGGELLWLPTDLTSVQLKLERSVEETTQFGVAGRLVTRGSLEVNHELRRNLILKAGIDYRTDEFQGSVREDDIYRLGAGANWFMTRRFGLNFRSGYVIRESSVPGIDYEQIFVGLQGIARY